MDQPTAKQPSGRRANEAGADVHFLKLKEVLAICGKSRSGVYAAIKKGTFPKPVRLQGRDTAWVKSEIQEWARECIRLSRAPVKERKRKQ